MSTMKMTVLGMSRYLSRLNDNLFKYLELPDGIDKDVVENNILLRSGEFEVLYSDAGFFQEAIGLWSQKWQPTFKKWYDALQITYNPLENYDRMEEWRDDNTNRTDGTTSGEAHTSGNGSGYTNGVGTNNRSAFDSSDYQPYDQNITHDDSHTENHDDTNNSTETHMTDKFDGIRTGRAHGNIGVTTSQQMLQSEFDIATWNIIEHITDMFIEEFVIPVYI